MIQNDPLPAKQAAAVAALLTQPTTEAAAAAVGVGRATLKRWLDEPAFRAALASAELQVIDHAVRRLLTMHGTALDVLTELMSEAPAPIKLRAAISVLELGTRLRDLRNEEQRLAELEQRLAELESEGKVQHARQ